MTHIKKLLCKECLETKPLDDFARNNTNKTHGRRPVCKNCENSNRRFKERVICVGLDVKTILTKNYGLAMPEEFTKWIRRLP